jgi:hypothetical protein
MVNSLAAFFALLLLIYHQVTTWFPLFPWNDIDNYSPKEIALEAGSNGILMGLAFACILISNKSFFHYYPLFYYPFLLFGEFFQWWLPFLNDKFAKSKVNFDYDRLYSNTLKLIPHRAGKRTPDANHIVLHLLSVITTVTVYFDRLS